MWWFILNAYRTRKFFFSWVSLHKWFHLVLHYQNEFSIVFKMTVESINCLVLSKIFTFSSSLTQSFSISSMICSFLNRLYFFRAVLGLQQNWAPTHASHPTINFLVFFLLSHLGLCDFQYGDMEMYIVLFLKTLLMTISHWPLVFIHFFFPLDILPDILFIYRSLMCSRLWKCHCIVVWDLFLPSAQIAPIILAPFL